MGMSHSAFLRRTEHRAKQRMIARMKTQASLAALLADRRAALPARCTRERCLLLDHCAKTFGREEARAADRLGRGRRKGAAGADGAAPHSSSLPLSTFMTTHGEEEVMRFVGSVFLLRQAELAALLQAADSLATRARATFDSPRVGFALSDWLLRVRSFHLVRGAADPLPPRSRFWRHIRDLFVGAQTGRVANLSEAD